ncbi:DinB family protein [Candidatus Thorarchaeota archaeon]|nr:MAG: DinB family protein [Candidatus Thorarchaeota archaeon]
MMTHDWFRERLTDAHKKQRTHLYRIIQDLSTDLVEKKVSDEERLPDMLSVLRHIGNSETYWFHKNGNDLLPPLRTGGLDEVVDHLERVTAAMIEMIRGCSEEELRVVPPTDERGPSISWCVLRTVQHGIYHAGQLAKMRHMIGAPPLEVDDAPWNAAVDAPTQIIGALLDESWK